MSFFVEIQIIVVLPVFSYVLEDVLRDRVYFIDQTGSAAKSLKMLNLLSDGQKAKSLIHRYSKWYL